MNRLLPSDIGLLVIAVYGVLAALLPALTPAGVMLGRQGSPSSTLPLGGVLLALVVPAMAALFLRLKRSYEVPPRVVLGAGVLTLLVTPLLTRTGVAIEAMVATGVMLVASPFLGRLRLDRWLKQRATGGGDRRLRGLEGLSEAYLAFVAGGKIVWANDAAVALLGYPLLGRDVGRYVPLLRDPERLAEMLADQCPVDTEVHHESSRSFAGEVMVTRRPVGGRALSIARITDASSRRARERSLERLALHDALTELPNRLLLHDRLRQALRAAERSSEPLALMILDLDRFKEVNDTLGHHVGDLLLRELGPRLATPLRRSDTLARLGGDEFAVLLPAPTPRDIACQVAERLVEQLAKPFLVEGMRLEIGVSIGVAVSPDHGMELEALLQSADSAMYKAKREGLGFVVFDEEEPSAYHRRLVLQRELRGAIEREELILLLQPKLAAAGRRVVGVEVLVRWAHPELGLLEPKDFLALAERTGLADQLALWTLNAALKEQRSWRLAGLDVPVSVNLAAGWLREPGAPKMLRLALDNWEARPGDLVLELAEDDVTSGLETTLPQLEAIAAMGCELSLDGFGTGFSPLIHLRRLPLSELKIDRSLIARTTEDRSAAVIVRSIVSLAHGLGLRVVGMGIDGPEAADWLATLRCDHLQGYFLAPPMDSAALDTWLGARASASAEG